MDDKQEYPFAEGLHVTDLTKVYALVPDFDKKKSRITRFFICLFSFFNKIKR